MKILKMKKLINFLFRKKKLDYPNDFAMIDYSPIALENGIRDDQNKIITRFFYNRYGNLTKEEYRYSEETAYVIEEVRGIPIHDKTKKKQRFPVFSRILPSEISYERF